MVRYENRSGFWIDLGCKKTRDTTLECNDVLKFAPGPAAQLVSERQQGPTLLHLFLGFVGQNILLVTYAVT